MNRATLSCKHAIDVEDGVNVGNKVACPKCPETKYGAMPSRTVKAIVRPTGDEVVDQALANVADELADTDEPTATEVVGTPTPLLSDLMNGLTGRGSTSNVSDMTKARTDRLNRAKAAAANGGDAAAVLAEPLPAGESKRKGGRQATRVCFLNLSRVRVGALTAAGFPADRLEDATVDLQADDVRMLLAELPKVCEADGPFKAAACRTADWLERFRADVTE